MFDNWMLWNGISFNPSQKSLEYIQKIRQRNSSLPADERRFLMITLKTPYFKELRTVLSGDDPTKVRDFFEKDMFRIFGPGILERHREAFLWAVEHIVQWPYQLGIGRRPARSRYLPGHIRHILWMAHTFYTQAVVDADICDILSGDLPEDALSFVRDSRTGFCSEIVAYEIDRGNVRL